MEPIPSPTTTEPTAVTIPTPATSENLLHTEPVAEVVPVLPLDNAAKLKKTREPYIEVGENDEGWHWQLYGGNGVPICRNSFPYKTKKHAVQAIRACPAIWEKVQMIVTVDVEDK